MLNVDVAIAYQSLPVTQGVANAINGADKGFILALTENEDLAEQVAAQNTKSFSEMQTITSEVGLNG